MPDILLHLAFHIAAALLYAGLGFHFWQTRRSNSPISAQRRAKYGLERLVIAVALLLQGIGLYASLFSTGSLRFSFSIAFSLMLWLAVLIYWLESLGSQMEGMLPIVLPLAAGAALSRHCSSIPMKSSTPRRRDSRFISWQPCWPTAW